MEPVTKLVCIRHDFLSSFVVDTCNNHKFIEGLFLHSSSFPLFSKLF